MLIQYIFAGLLGVSNMILWGVYGDLLVEKFYWRKVFRSIALGLAWSILLYFTNSNLPLLIVALSVICLERITTEIYKVLIRYEDQEKYKIPSDLNIKANRIIKIFFGLALIFGIAALVMLADIRIEKIVIILAIGFFTALSGMLKDAPYEGFQPFKFFRSPGVALAVGAIIWLLFPEIEGKFLLLSIAGGERICSEFYKKIYKGRVPGKFKEKDFDREWLDKRSGLLYFYAADILAIIALAI